MANELTVSASLSFTKGSITAALAKNGLQITITGTKKLENVQNIGTSEEALQLGDLGSAAGCWLIIINRDPTNYVNFRAATGVTDTCKLMPGEPALFRCAASAPYLQANTAACNVEYCLIEA